VLKSTTLIPFTYIFSYTSSIVGYIFTAPFPFPIEFIALATQELIDYLIYLAGKRGSPFSFRFYHSSNRYLKASF